MQDSIKKSRRTTSHELFDISITFLFQEEYFIRSLTMYE